MSPDPSTPITVWLTGLSGAGKTTLAEVLCLALGAKGRLSVVLDGDELRRGINRDLSFSPQDRAIAVRRAAELARRHNEAGRIVVAALVSPFREHRATARALIGPERFHEVHVSTPLATCEARDRKGLYAAARAGRLAQFTGISSPYEAPESPALSIDTSVLPLERSIDLLLALLTPPSGTAG